MEVQEVQEVQVEQEQKQEQKVKVDIFVLQKQVRELFPNSTSSLIDDLLGIFLVA